MTGVFSHPVGPRLIVVHEEDGRQRLLDFLTSPETMHLARGTGEADLLGDDGWFLAGVEVFQERRQVPRPFRSLRSLGTANEGECDKGEAKGAPWSTPPASRSRKSVHDHCSC